MIRFVPGGPFTARKRPSAPEILRRNLEAHYGLDKPLHQQYFDYLGSLLLQGDLGPSFKYPSRTVNEIIADKLPVSTRARGLTSLADRALVFGLIARRHRRRKAQHLLRLRLVELRSP